MTIGQIMHPAPVNPVPVIETAAQAGPIAEVSVKGGLPVIEVTLRTPCAFEAMAQMAKIEGAIVGAETARKPADPAIGSGIPFSARVAHAGEVMRGPDRFKFFPRTAVDGLPPPSRA